jgi:hypothetical protein
MDAPLIYPGTPGNPVTARPRNIKAAWLKIIKLLNLVDAHGLEALA